MRLVLALMGALVAVPVHADDQPPFLPYVEGQTVPAGYRKVTKWNSDVSQIGVAFFWGAYGWAVSSAAWTAAMRYGDVRRPGTVFIPFVGPLLFSGDNDLDALGRATMIGCTVVEAAGAVVALAGLWRTETRLYREGVVAVQPMVGPSVLGLSFTAPRF